MYAYSKQPFVVKFPSEAPAASMSPLRRAVNVEDLSLDACDCRDCAFGTLRGPCTENLLEPMLVSARRSGFFCVVLRLTTLNETCLARRPLQGEDQRSNTMCVVDSLRNESGTCVKKSVLLLACRSYFEFRGVETRSRTWSPFVAIGRRSCMSQCLAHRPVRHPRRSRHGQPRLGYRIA